MRTLLITVLLLNHTHLAAAPTPSPRSERPLSWWEAVGCWYGRWGSYEITITLYRDGRYFAVYGGDKFTVIYRGIWWIEGREIIILETNSVPDHGYPDRFNRNKFPVGSRTDRVQVFRIEYEDLPAPNEEIITSARLER